MRTRPDTEPASEWGPAPVVMLWGPGRHVVRDRLVDAARARGTALERLDGAVPPPRLRAVLRTGSLFGSARVIELTDPTRLSPAAIAVLGAELGADEDDQAEPLDLRVLAVVERRPTTWPPSAAWLEVRNCPARAPQTVMAATASGAGLELTPEALRALTDAETARPGAGRRALDAARLAGLRTLDARRAALLLGSGSSSASDPARRLARMAAVAAAEEASREAWTDLAEAAETLRFSPEDAAAALDLIAARRRARRL